MSTNIDHPSADGATPRRRRDRTHWLYLAVIAAVLGGVALGLIAPSAGKEVGVAFIYFLAMSTVALGLGLRSAHDLL